VGRHPELTDHARSLGSAEPVTAADVRAARFPVAVRGYDLADVDALLRRVAASLAAREGERPQWPAPPVPPAPGEAPQLRTARRGYDQPEVDAFLVRCAHSLGAGVAQVPELAPLTRAPRVGPPLRARDVGQVQFRLVRRGYAIDEVDLLLDRVEQALRR
jgi:DivIVA domain-containing protein